MWKSGVDVKVSNTDVDDDDWETDADFVVMIIWFFLIAVRDLDKKNVSKRNRNHQTQAGDFCLYPIFYL